MKHYVILSGIIGGIIGSVLTALLVSPVTAHRDNFGEIECTRLAVVDAEGKERILLSTNHIEQISSHKLTAQGKSLRVDDTKVHVLGYELGGRVQIYDEVGATMVVLARDERGGFINVSGKDSLSGVSLRNLEHGGRVSTSSSLGKAWAVMGINEYGNGAVSTYDKNGHPQ